MLEHARNLEFEKAARVRDQLALLREQAFGADGIQIVLDLGPCSHLSSTGLGVLFSLARWVGPKGGKVIAVGPSVQLLRVLRLVEKWYC